MIAQSSLEMQCENALRLFHSVQRGKPLVTRGEQTMLISQTCQGDPSASTRSKNARGKRLVMSSAQNWLHWRQCFVDIASDLASSEAVTLR
jgi:hypothetical protein